MSILQIEYVPIGTIKPNPRNARTHSKKQIKQLAESFRAFGFANPLIIDDQGMLLAGHGRLAAAELLGIDELPCVRLSSMTARQKRAYALADNKLALNAGWDEQVLALELQELLEIDPTFEVSVTGFSIAEIDTLVEGLSPQELTDPKDERLPGPSMGLPTARLGDVWMLGPHRLTCGDSLSQIVVAALMNGEKAQMVFTDPPYNVRIAGHVSGLGKTMHREFSQACGEMTPEQFTAFLKTAFANLADHSCDGSVHFICMDWRHMKEIQSAGEAVYGELKNLVIWAKDVGGMGSFYRSRHELIFAFKNGNGPHINTFELGQNGRYRTNIWQYRGANSFKAGRMEELALHPTVKPVAMIADAIKDVSGRNGIVLDLFGGSGSTLIAAHKTGRRGFLCELDPIYCDRIIQRWQAYAKDDAILLSTSKTFTEMAIERVEASGPELAANQSGKEMPSSGDAIAASPAQPISSFETNPEE